ncbi:hypothetical protein MYP_2802 [Sporocytophaga myxococcoides]|uniref:Uncharacterized protein n=1 Tax=Sporocytophaga myxococcoides TaxID=153721 RepID=A0A098LHD3_9BACT|nr:hypothetical protein MYP_2802 [Sporocytophaga myxococcoides]
MLFSQRALDLSVSPAIEWVQNKTKKDESKIKVFMLYVNFNMQKYEFWSIER